MTRHRADWRKTGEKLREQILAGIEATLSDRQKRFGNPDKTFTVYEPAGSADPAFIDAALKAEFFGERDPLIQYLSERSLGKPEQLALAQILEEPKPKTGRPKNVALLACESVANALYRSWRQIHKRDGIADHGHREEMKEFAARVAVELASKYPNEGPPKALDESVVDGVRELMDRPKQRRATLDDALKWAIEARNSKCRQKP